jgi:hypothetical protein
MARALTERVLAMVLIPSHNKQGHRANFEIGGEEGHCCSYLLKIKMTG